MNLNNHLVFTKLITYKKSRDIKTLSNDSIIRKLDKTVADRVISSMLVPSKNSIKLYNETFKKSIIDEVINLVINLNLKLFSSYDYKNLVFISVLRSGHFLTELLKHLIYKLYKIKIEVICVSPNYINNVNYTFKNYINFSEKEFIFIDGWMSRGVTYNVLKKFWEVQKIKKVFKMAVLSNLSINKNKDIISLTDRDILIPWSICQTDNLGLSNFFLHPENKEPTSFFIPNNNRVIGDFLHKCVIMIDKKIGKDKNKNRNFNKLRKGVIEFHQNNYRGRLVKIGINECIKSIDKGDVKAMYVSKDLEEPYYSIFTKYCAINKIESQFTNKEYSYVVKRCSQ